MTSNKDLARERALGTSDIPKGLKEIHGYDFNNGTNYDNIFASMETTGFQASHLAKAIDIINTMRSEGCTVYLGYTSSMVTSGLRDIFRYLAEHKLVDIIVTTAGGIEEDIIKCLKPSFLGTFTADGRTLREKRINRTGNIFVPSTNYCTFEDFFIPFLTTLHKRQQDTKQIITSSELIKALGQTINDNKSIYYWCAKNNIPVYCPALTDGSMGDMLYFFSFDHPDFKIDLVKDLHDLHEFTFSAKKTGVIILGAGLIKHHILNTNLMRNGCDYAVYINTSREYDGSDAGARPDEAVSWGKITAKDNTVKVFGDATILFPLIVAQTFAKERKTTSSA